jgi:hypothetical protein
VLKTIHSVFLRFPSEPTRAGDTFPGKHGTAAARASGTVEGNVVGAVARNAASDCGGSSRTLPGCKKPEELDDRTPPGGRPSHGEQHPRYVGPGGIPSLRNPHERGGSKQNSLSLDVMHRALHRAVDGALHCGGCNLSSVDYEHQIAVIWVRQLRQNRMDDWFMLSGCRAPASTAT